MDQENNLPTQRYQEVASRLKPSMSGFRAMPEESRFEEIRQPNTRQLQAVSRTGTHPSVSGNRTGVMPGIGGRTGSYGRVGRTGQYARAGGQTGQLPRVGGVTGTFGRVTSSQNPVRKAQERSRRRQDVDPAMAMLVGVGVVMFALLIYGMSRPTVSAQPETAPLTKDEQNRLARAINAERAKQAELLYREEPAPAAPGQRVATPPPGSVIIRTVPAQKPVESAPRVATGGVAAGFSGQTERLPAVAPEIIIVEEKAAPVIPAKPVLPQGGIAAGMLSSETERRLNPASADRTKNPAALVAEPAAAAAAAPAVPAPKVQRSKKSAPHGGALYEIGPGVALLEFAVERQTGTLSLYVMDPVKLTRLMVRQPLVELQVPAYAQTFNLRGQSGSAQFAGQYEVLRGNNEPIRALIPTLTVNGQEFKDIAVEF